MGFLVFLVFGGGVGVFLVFGGGGGGVVVVVGGGGGGGGVQRLSTAYLDPASLLERDSSRRQSTPQAPDLLSLINLDMAKIRSGRWPSKVGDVVAAFAASDGTFNRKSLVASAKFPVHGDAKRTLVPFISSPFTEPYRERWMRSTQPLPGDHGRAVSWRSWISSDRL